MIKRSEFNIESLDYDYGIIKYEEYLKYRPLRKKDWIKSILVFVFPYQYQKEEGQYLTARFAYGKDYHILVKDRLEEIANKLQLNRFEVMTDVSYLDEKLCASLAGIGTIGKNNLIISNRFGTFVVIGEIVTDEEFDYYDEEIESLCVDCDLCIKACPTKALDDGFDRKKCLSYLTQMKSKDFSLYDNITDVCYGCDLCQEICIHNFKNHKYLNEFKYNEKSIFDLNNFKDLNEERFQELYADKTFNWIGYLKMLRNIIVIEANNNNISIEELNYFQNLFENETWFYDHLEYLKGKLKDGHC